MEKCTKCFKRIGCWVIWVIVAVILFLSLFPFILSIYRDLGTFPEFLHKSFGNKDLINEVEVSMAFIASMAAVAIAWIAYFQIRPIKKTMKMEFIRHLDEQWISPEITKVRCELWEVYWKACQEKETDDGAVEAVQDYVVKYLHNDSKKTPSGKNIRNLFGYLNFLDVMGTIYIYKESGVLKKEEIEMLYSGKLMRYLKFYEKYFKCHESNAKLLFEELKK